jgi:hypothetical protein
MKLCMLLGVIMAQLDTNNGSAAICWWAYKRTCKLTQTTEFTCINIAGPREWTKLTAFELNQMLAVVL